MGLTAEKKYTYEDYLKTPDDRRYELIEGELLMSPSPVTRHQSIVLLLASEISGHVRKKGLGQVFISPCDVVFDNFNVLQPDILFISSERLHIITEKNIQGAPDLIIEVLSDNSVYRDTIQKKRLYSKFGVKEYWIVAPDDCLIEVYTLKAEGEYQLKKTYLLEDTIESEVIEGLRIELRNIFA